MDQHNQKAYVSENKSAHEGTTPPNITEAVIEMNSHTTNPRLKYLMEGLVRHLHDFTRETNVTIDEWMQAIKFLTEVGQKCTDVRQETILLSDVLGISSLVDSQNYLRPPNATENCVLGPFHTEDSQDLNYGESIASEGKGERLLVRGQVTDSNGKPIPNCLIETWETDGDGMYDVQYEGPTVLDCRGRLRTTKDGKYEFWGVKPVSYPIPVDGPVGYLLSQLERHAYRPAHLHFIFTADGYQQLVTALYTNGDEYLESDPVLGAKPSLAVDYTLINDADEAKKLGTDKTPFWFLEYNFILVSKEETEALRNAAVNIQ